MSAGESFEDRLKAMADQLAKSLSDSDIDEVAQRFGVDPERARGVANTLERWLSERSSDPEPPIADQPNVAHTPRSVAPETSGVGPHPLDLPTPDQGLALSALDSGRFTVRPGSSVLAATGADSNLSVRERVDLVNELRARDWITPDGTLTMVGRQALLRWCRTAEVPAQRSEAPIT
jgi:hypothetical protein